MSASLKQCKYIQTHALSSFKMDELHVCKFYPILLIPRVKIYCFTRAERCVSKPFYQVKKVKKRNYSVLPGFTWFRLQKSKEKVG